MSLNEAHKLMRSRKNNSKDKKCFMEKTFSKTKIKKIHRRVAAEWTGTDWREGDLFWSGAVGGLGSG